MKSDLLVGPSMGHAPLILCVLVAITFCQELFAQQSVSSSLPTIELVGGQWFDRRDFKSRTMFIENGTLRKTRPAAVDQVIDLQNGYVIPPFGEAHSHRPATPDRFGPSSRMFLRDGVYYVMNHGNLSRYQREFAKQVADPATIDGQFAGAVLASPQSHAVELWQRLVSRGSFPGVTVESLAGDAWFVVESEAGLREQWPKYLKTNPDFVKIMVEYSEEFVTRHDNKKYFGQSGLHPKLVPQIVQLAHQEGLRVSAHIETAADFHVVVDAGVDVVAHLPGYDIPIDADDRQYQINPKDAVRAKQQNTTVITTTILGVDRADGDQARLQKIQRIQKHNIEVLAKAGVSIAVGSDQFSKNSVEEAMNLSALGIIDNLTLLNMLCSITPRIIFPKRKIGSLDEGCEASFLVLKQNPLNDLQHLRDIQLRVKQGRMLEQNKTNVQKSAMGVEVKSTLANSDSRKTLVISNCHIVSVEDGRVIPAQTVLIENGVISYVGPKRQFEHPDSATIIDGSGKFVMPGLVDMHVHIGHESELTSYLLHGVTTVCNLGGDYVDLFSDDRINICKLRSAVAAGKVVGPRIFTAGQALDGDPRTGPFQRALSGPAAAAQAVLEQKKQGFDFIKVYDALDETTLKTIVRTAAEYDLAVIGHIPEKPGVERTLASGVKLIAHAEEFYPSFEGAKDIESTARQLAALVKESGVSVIPNTAFVRRLIAQLEDLPAVLADNRVDLLAPRVRRWWTPEYNYYTRRDNREQFLVDTKQKYEWLIPFVRELHQAGVPLLIGTDSSIPGALPGFSMLEEFKDLKSAGLEPLDILKTATVNPAKFLEATASLIAPIGEVRVGCTADLLLLNKNPLDNLFELDKAVERVFFNGNHATVVELRRLLSKQAKDF